MQKYNSLIKKIKKQFLTINDLIESYFDKISLLKSNIKKFKFDKNNSIFLAFGIIVILSLSYLLMPTLYDKNMIQSKIKNQILKNYNINLTFNEKIKYGLLPKPHFYSKDLVIKLNDKTIGFTKTFKIFFEINKLFSINKLDFGDLIFTNTDFEIQKDDLEFFENLLKTEPNENKIYIKKSNIFFKDVDNEVLFINKINDSKFFYDSNNLNNILSSQNEIFNVPYKLIIKNDKFNREVYTKFNSKKMRLNIENIINYDEINKDGNLNILLINKKTSLNYELKKNSLSFISSDTQREYSGKIDFRPFYFFANFNYEGISSKNIFNSNTILIDFIKSEIFNNKNLNAKINLSVGDITNIDELNNLYLSLSIDEGNLNFSNSNIMWKEDLKITLTESLLIHDQNEINLNGKMILEFKNSENFYKSFQIKKNHRKDIKQIHLDFVYNFNQQKIIFDNILIDNNQNINIESFVKNYNVNNNKIFNKITFKNFVNNFFSAYAG